MVPKWVSTVTPPEQQYTLTFGVDVQVHLRGGGAVVYPMKPLGPDDYVIRGGPKIERIHGDPLTVFSAPYDSTDIGEQAE